MPFQGSTHAPQPTSPDPLGHYPLGEDILLVRAMSGKERLSTLFEYELELISEYADIKHEDLLDQLVTVRREQS